MASRLQTTVLAGLVRYLDVESPGQLVTALGLHGLHFCPVEGVQSQVLHFGVVLWGAGQWEGLKEDGHTRT